MFTNKEFPTRKSEKTQVFSFPLSSEPHPGSFVINKWGSRSPPRTTIADRTDLCTGAPPKSIERTFRSSGRSSSSFDSRSVLTRPYLDPHPYPRKGTWSFPRTSPFRLPHVSERGWSSQGRFGTGQGFPRPSSLSRLGLELQCVWYLTPTLHPQNLLLSEPHLPCFTHRRDR